MCSNCHVTPTVSLSAASSQGRPDTTKNYVIDVKKEFWRRTDGPNATSLPEYFKNHHYRVWGMGKVATGPIVLLYPHLSCDGRPGVSWR
jgi:hypothetical protein